MSDYHRGGHGSGGRRLGGRGTGSRNQNDRQNPPPPNTYVSPHMRVMTQQRQQMVVDDEGDDDVEVMPQPTVPPSAIPITIQPPHPAGTGVDEGDDDVHQITNHPRRSQPYRFRPPQRQDDDGYPQAVPAPLPQQQRPAPARNQNTSSSGGTAEGEGPQSRRNFLRQRQQGENQHQHQQQHHVDPFQQRGPFAFNRPLRTTATPTFGRNEREHQPSQHQPSTAETDEELARRLQMEEYHNAAVPADMFRNNNAPRPLSAAARNRPHQSPEHVLFQMMGRHHHHHHHHHFGIHSDDDDDDESQSNGRSLEAYLEHLHHVGMLAQPYGGGGPMFMPHHAHRFNRNDDLPSYEELVQLEDVPRGTSLTKVEKNSFTSEVPQCESYETCTVCLGPMEAGETIRTLNKCCHSFHKGCIDPWLTGHEKKCPICKVEVV